MPEFKKRNLKHDNVNLFEDQLEYFKERGHKSPRLRQLIDDSEDFKKWQKERKK